MTAPALLRIGSTSIGFKQSNTSHTVSARRNTAAGVTVPKETFRRRPSLSRWAVTEAAPSPAFASGGGGSGAATMIFGATSAKGVAIGVLAGTSAACAAISLAGRAGAAVSGAGDAFGADPGLISILACSAVVSEGGGTLPPALPTWGVSPAGV